MTYRIASDIGGTFTDLVISRDGMLVGRFKSATTPDDLSIGVLNCLELAATDLNTTIEELLSHTDVFIHGSTVATNAVLEGKVAKVGIICTSGTKYTLWRGEGRRQNIFDFTTPERQPLVRPHLCIELKERIDCDGNVLEPLDEEEVRAATKKLRSLGCKAIAVCLLWSIRNPVHEQRVGEIVRVEWPDVTLSLSSEVQPVIREYTRMSCTALNAMLKPVIAVYLRALEERLRANALGGELLIVTSDGGVQPVADVAERPVYMLFSGPSTGPSAAQMFAAKETTSDCLLIDMGGTSFDVSTVIDGQIAVTRDGRINDHPTGVSAVQILTLGAGGGSIASVDAGGLLRVGPDSAGAQPGPACYSRGGLEPTVTDAYLTLGFVLADRFLGGRMKLSLEAATNAIRTKIAEPLGISVEDAALGICRVVNERMVNGILEMTVRRGIDPRQLVLVTGGGATGIAAVELARELGISRIIFPRETSVLCAYGALNADLIWSNVASEPTSINGFDFARINDTLKRLTVAGTAFLDRLDVAPELRRQSVYAAARYPMQVTEIEVPCPHLPLNEADVSDLAQAFHTIHKNRYKVSEPESDVELVMWRAAARGVTASVRHAEADNERNIGDAAILGQTRFYDSDTRCFVEASMIDPDQLLVGEKFNGPALVIAADTTVVLPPNTTATAHADGHLLVELGPT